jgi:hypothetical protein
LATTRADEFFVLGVSRYRLAEIEPDCLPGASRHRPAATITLSLSVEPLGPQAVVVDGNKAALPARDAIEGSLGVMGSPAIANRGLAAEHLASL